MAKHIYHDPPNLVKLTVYDHAIWHYELWCYYGFQEDYVAWKCLSGQIGKEEIFIEKSKIGGNWHKDKPENLKSRINIRLAKIGPKNPMYGKPVTDEHRLKNKLANRHLGGPTFFINSKDHYFNNPEGEKIKIHNLTQFCRDNNLILHTMRAVKNGITKIHKGWKRAMI